MSTRLLAVVATVMAAVILVLGQALLPVVRTGAALLLVLVLPGYAFTAATPGGRSLPASERLSLSIGISLAITALGGVALNLLPAGLTLGPWLALLSLFTLIAGAAAVLRRRTARPACAPGPQLYGLSARQAALLGLAAVLLVAALAVAVVSDARSRTTFTQLWILPDEPAAGDAVRIGLRNEEQETVAYRLELRAAGRVVEQWPTVELRAGQAQEYTVSLAGVPGWEQAEAVLYRLDAPGSVYRRVHLHANTAGS